MSEEWVSSMTRRMGADIVERQEAWLREQCEARGMTPEQLAEVYELEYQPTRYNLNETDWIFSATQEVRLRRRDQHAEVVGQENE